METLLFLAHTQADGLLPKAALEALTGAVDLSKKMGATLTVGLIGEKIDSAAGSIAASGAAKFLSVSGVDFSVSRYATDAAACEALIKASKATIVVAPSTSHFQRALPGVAQRIGGKIDTHVTALKVEGGKLQIERWYYRQRMVANLWRENRPWIILVETGVFEAFKTASGTAKCEAVSVTLSASAKRTKVVGLQAPQTATQTIRPDAKVLFVAGAGWGKKQSDGQMHTKDAEKIILTFLEKTQSSLGSSKSLVDQSAEGEAVLSFMSHLNQVGQTGSTPRHPKGLATCCHGEEPHAVGWRFINDRRAVNLDPNCGWAQGKADILYVADAFQVMTKVNELLAK